MRGSGMTYRARPRFWGLMLCAHLTFAFQSDRSVFWLEGSMSSGPLAVGNVVFENHIPSVGNFQASVCPACSLVSDSAVLSCHRI